MMMLMLAARALCPMSSFYTDDLVKKKKILERIPRLPKTNKKTPHILRRKMNTALSSEPERNEPFSFHHTPAHHATFLKSFNFKSSGRGFGPCRTGLNPAAFGSVLTCACNDGAFRCCHEPSGTEVKCRNNVCQLLTAF